MDYSCRRGLRVSDSIVAELSAGFSGLQRSPFFVVALWNPALAEKTLVERVCDPFCLRRARGSGEEHDPEELKKHEVDQAGGHTTL